jgi:hypothetical protein
MIRVIGGCLSSLTLILALPAGGQPAPRSQADKISKADANRWKDLANKGDIKAQVNLAYAYYSAKDYEQALKWFRKVVERGGTDENSAYAYSALGSMLQQGLGIAPDSVQALMWTTISADLGNQSAATTRQVIASQLSSTQTTEAQRLAEQWLLAKGLPPAKALGTEVGEPSNLAEKYPELADVLGDPLIATYLPGLRSPNPLVEGRAYHAIEAYKDQKAQAAQQVAFLKQKLEAMKEMGIDISKLPPEAIIALLGKGSSK